MPTLNTGSSQATARSGHSSPPHSPVVAFAVGALIVVLTILTTPRSERLPTTFLAVALSLCLTSLVLAHWGHVPVARHHHQERVRRHDGHARITGHRLPVRLLEASSGAKSRTSGSEIPPVLPAVGQEWKQWFRDQPPNRDAERSRPCCCVTRQRRHDDLGRHRATIRLHMADNEPPPTHPRGRRSDPYITARARADLPTRRVAPGHPHDGLRRSVPHNVVRHLRNAERNPRRFRNQPAGEQGDTHALPSPAAHCVFPFASGSGSSALPDSRSHTPGESGEFP